MSECKRCEGKKIIQESKDGIIVVRPCPQCNMLQVSEEKVLDISKAIELWEKHTIP